MARKTRNQNAILRMIGDPARVARELRQFRQTTRLLSSQHPRMIEKYPKKWVALYGGKVKATGRSLDAVLKGIDKAGLPRSAVIVRFIEKNRRTMIL